jgi:hypothetical protein
MLGGPADFKNLRNFNSENSNSYFNHPLLNRMGIDYSIIIVILNSKLLSG